jgi:hypothetical protein
MSVLGEEKKTTSHRWADTGIHGTTKRQVATMLAEGKPSLLPLPLEPFRYYRERVVHLVGCVEVEAAYYGLPPGWIGRLVKVQWDALHVRILHPGTNSTSSRAPPPETRLMQSPFRMLLRAASQKSLKHKTKMRSGAARGGHSRTGK